MKYFESDHRHNWVDENNVFVGYDSMQCCCEQHGWHLTDKVPLHDGSEEDAMTPPADGWDNYRFVPEFFSEINGGEGGTATFKIQNISTQKILYLSIWNYHTGYYAHGFEFKDGDKVLEEGRL